MLAIPVWRYHKNDNWFRDLISRLIVYFTGYEYTHVGLYFEGKLYESTIWVDYAGKLKSGIRITEIGDPRVRPPDFCMVPWQIKLTEDRMRRIRTVLAQYGEQGRPYNVFKLITLPFVWPTRWFWKKIRWVPFNSEVFGEVCSSFVDEVMYKARWDLFPDEWEGYTVPGQYLSIPGWRVDQCTK